jgi:hypothetical protein
MRAANANAIAVFSPSLCNLHPLYQRQEEPVKVDWRGLITTLANRLHCVFPKLKANILCEMKLGRLTKVMATGMGKKYFGI